MEYKKLQVGLIGCGTIASDHLGAIKSKCGPVELYLCDRNLEAVHKLGQAKGLNFKAYEDAGKLITERQLDVVHVLTPPDSHYEIAKLALQNRIHVLVEKPMTIKISEAQELFSLAEKVDRKLCVDHSLLFMECVLKAFEIIRMGKLGDVIAVHCFFGHAKRRKTIPYGDVSHWSYSLPGGPLMNLISHPASLLVALLGDPEVMNSICDSRNLMPFGFSDLLSVSINTVNGHGSFTISMEHGNSARYVNVECEDGSIYIDLGRQLTIIKSHKGRLGFISKALSGLGESCSYCKETLGVIFRVGTGRLKPNPGTRGLIARFYNSIRRGTPCPVKKENAIGVATICEKVFAGCANSGSETGLLNNG